MFDTNLSENCWLEGRTLVFLVTCFRCDFQSIYLWYLTHFSKKSFLEFILAFLVSFLLVVNAILSSFRAFLFFVFNLIATDWSYYSPYLPIIWSVPSYWKFCGISLYWNLRKRRNQLYINYLVFFKFFHFFSCLCSVFVILAQRKFFYCILLDYCLISFTSLSWVLTFGFTVYMNLFVLIVNILNIWLSQVMKTHNTITSKA